MKKFYVSSKYKKIIQIRTKRAYKQKRKKAQRKKEFNSYLLKKHILEEKLTKPKTYKDKKSNRYIVETPKIFSFFENIDEMLGFFYDLTNHAKNNHKVFLDMSKIKKLSPDALLYMLARLDYYKKKYNFDSISGNLPYDEFAKKALIESGFFKYVKTNFNIPKGNDNILSIESDKLVQPKISQEVVKFSMSHLGQKKSQKTRTIYKTIIECMSNTRNHAYKKTNISPKWYLMALYKKEEKTIQFIFLDAGLGIPKTIRMKHTEKVRKLLKKMFGSLTDRFELSDSLLIKSALNGEFRTRTKTGYRGKGLPTIYEYSKRKLIKNLKFLSNKGYLDCDKKIVKDLDHRFFGTLISWEFN